jgi:hypothetical protein
MTSQGNGKLVRFKISNSGVLAEQLKRLEADAQLAGVMKDVKPALVVIKKRLQEDPLGFGELVGSFKKLDLIVHVAIVRPLLVRFAIHQVARFVVVMKVAYLS